MIYLGRLRRELRQDAAVISPTYLPGEASRLGSFFLSRPHGAAPPPGPGPNQTRPDSQACDRGCSAAHPPLHHCAVSTVAAYHWRCRYRAYCQHIAEYKRTSHQSQVSSVPTGDNAPPSAAHPPACAPYATLPRQICCPPTELDKYG